MNEETREIITKVKIYANDQDKSKAEEIQKKIFVREAFLEKMDNRQEDLYEEEQEKYDKYEKELKELYKQLEDIKKRMIEKEEVIVL